MPPKPFLLVPSLLLYIYHEGRRRVSVGVFGPLGDPAFQPPPKASPAARIRVGGESGSCPVFVLRLSLRRQRRDLSLVPRTAVVKRFDSTWLCAVGGFCVVLRGGPALPDCCFGAKASCVHEMCRVLEHVCISDASWFGAEVCVSCLIFLFCCCCCFYCCCFCTLAAASSATS